jgi:hypothetical protein
MSFELHYAAADDEVARFLELACLTYYHDDSPARREAARELLEANPDLAQQNIYTASCVGNSEAVRQMLDADSDLANRKGGPLDWEPLLYACYSRLNLAGQSTLDVARLLLERGADSNAHYMWGAQYKFTALTGTFGEGEVGPTNQPEHEQCEALARLLLEAGADPNDSQALYNRMFTPGNRCLEILLEFGLGSDARCNWLISEGDQLAPNPQQTLHYQLLWAIRHYHTERAKLLIDHGAEVSAPYSDGDKTPYELAMICGHTQIAEYLLSQGARPTELSTVDALAAACMGGDLDMASAILSIDPDWMMQLEQEHGELLHDAASEDRQEAVRTLVAAGFNVNHCTATTALHQAAWSGQLDMVKLLIELGADVTIRDKCHNSPALGWADFNNQTEVADFLRSRDNSC